MYSRMASKCVMSPWHPCHITQCVRVRFFQVRCGRGCRRFGSMLYCSNTAASEIHYTASKSFVVLSEIIVRCCCPQVIYVVILRLPRAKIAKKKMENPAVRPRDEALHGPGAGGLSLGWHYKLQCSSSRRRAHYL